jgi:hypothetical protein
LGIDQETEKRLGHTRAVEPFKKKKKKKEIDVSYFKMASQPRIPQVLGGPEREADHSLQTSTEVKNKWIYTYTPPYVFTA